MARHDLEQIVAHGKVERGYLGILPQDLTPALAKAMNTNQTNGALIGDVTPNSPASKAGLKQGDIVTALNGEPIASANQLRLKIGLMEPNATVTLQVMRDAKSQDVPVTLGDFPSKEEQASLQGDKSEGTTNGISVENLTTDIAQQLNVPTSTKGVVVDQVSAASKAADSGLERGDVIEQVNHQPVKNIQDFNQAMNQVKPDQSVLFLVNRQGTTIFLAL
jgi:serine protease Do